MRMQFYLTSLLFFSMAVFCSSMPKSQIDRNALVTRNNVHVAAFDSLSPLSVGNGGFAYTVDVTGMQSFPQSYAKGIPLGTESDWGWHSFTNHQAFRHSETLKEYDFGRGHKELYAIQVKDDERKKAASEWFRANPHRLHLGVLGFDIEEKATVAEIEDVDQTLDLWEGKIISHFKWKNSRFKVLTVCHPSEDHVSVKISNRLHTPIRLRLPYPTGAHSDDACNWEANEKHLTVLVRSEKHSALLKHILDSTVYYIGLRWEGKASLKEKSRNYFVLIPHEDNLSVSCAFMKVLPSSESTLPDYAETEDAARRYWGKFWEEGAAVDFSHCTDPRARELERRVVLSQYLLAIQSAGKVPPQETGLTYNSWFGRPHLEMIFWHQAWLSLWGHSKLLDRTLNWYFKAEPMARVIARRQGFEGIRWMKMTDSQATEAPSNVGSFLIWQQPHIIYLAELLYRANPDRKVLDKYNSLVQETARFMYSFATYDEKNMRYILKGCIPAQETLAAATTVNPPFELSYWHFAMQLAQEWRERMGQRENLDWKKLIDELSALAYNEDGLYLAAENAVDTYKDIRYTSDHMAVLGCVGILPMNKLIRTDYMKNTLDWVWNNWNWGKTWGWDYPMTAMNATRLGDAEKAVGALLMDKRTNTYLPNGHNYQDSRLRLYLPGNGGLLTAVALMCAGWDGCTVKNPGFPKDGKWNVVWEGLLPLP